MQLLALDTFGGLPAHPLVVHIPVVLIPVAFALALLSFWKPVRTGALWAATGSASVGLIGAALAGGSGESLQNAVDRTDLVRDHAQAGEIVAPFASLFLVVLLCALVVHLSKTDSVPFLKSVSIAKKAGAGAMTALLALSSVVGVAASWATYAAGHTGAKSAWHKVDLSRVTEGEEGDDD